MVSNKTKTIVPIILVVLFLIVVLAFKAKKSHEYDLVISADSLLNIVSNSTQLIEPTELAGLIETNSERFIIIDIRSQHNYNISRIENAINISFNDILSEKWNPILSDVNIKKILYCDYDINSNEAWMLLMQLGYKNIFVLEGGIKYWEEHILKNYSPFSYPSNDEHPLYNYKKEMNKGDKNPNQTETKETSAPIQITTKKKKSVEGGCG